MVMNHGPDCTTKASNDDHMMNTHFPKLAEIIHLHTCTQMYTPVHACTHMCTHVHTCSIHVHICTHMYIHNKNVFSNINSQYFQAHIQE